MRPTCSSEPNRFSQSRKCREHAITGAKRLISPLVRADAPTDRFARGDYSAMSAAQERGALVCFAKGRCVACHAVARASNEMFSDFRMHVVAVIQIAPIFAVGVGNVIFDGAGEDEDFGLEQMTRGRRTAKDSVLRCCATRRCSRRSSTTARTRGSTTRFGITSTPTPRRALARLDPLLAEPIVLSPREFEDLVHFVGEGLLDERAHPQQLWRLVSESVPSGRPLPPFQGCAQLRCSDISLAEPEGFEPSMQVLPTYSLSRGAPSATRSQLRWPRF
jgi:cytochrome c peroxidase